MKYNSSNQPIVCMMTQSTCYNGTSRMTPQGVLWHSTGANNPTLRRYVQPSDNDPNRAYLLNLIGKNAYGNDWNHISISAGVNAWIGKLADGTVASVQTLPWEFKPWGCGSGKYGSCNNTHMQFEICEDGLNDVNYFNAVYREACELTAYYCKMYNINPHGTFVYNGVTVPTILCHQDSCRLGLGGNHADVYHWFNRYGKTMDDVRNDVASLMGSSQPVEVKEYKVVANIPKYATAGDAQAKTNVKGTYAPGTYYVYNKYPNGVNGMLNISIDKTGNSAGGWINPSENFTQQTAPQPTVNKLYRVRKSKDDAKSQKGAFSSLDNAKAACQEAGDGYHVFDWNYNIVYSYKKPETVTPVQPDAPQTPAYELNYTEKNLIIDKRINRTNRDCVRAINKILVYNKDFDVEIAKSFFRIAPYYGIDPMMAIAQSVLETGWFKYSGSAVKPEQHNYCGLGVTSNGLTGASFNTIDDGVVAQLQHLYAYGCKDELPLDDEILDPRFDLVTRGIAIYWQQLAGRWAVPGYDKNTYATAEDAMNAGATYGQKIASLCKQMENTSAVQSDVEKYFGETDDFDNDTDDVTPDNNEDNVFMQIISKLVEMVIRLFSKK